MILHDVRDRHHHGIRRRSSHGEAAFVQLPEANRHRQGQRVAGTGLFFGGGDDPYVVGQPARDPFEQREPARVDAVIVGEEDAHVACYGRGRPHATAPSRYEEVPTRGSPTLVLIRTETVAQAAAGTRFNPRRATSAAAASPNRMTIGGAGTSVGGGPGGGGVGGPGGVGGGVGVPKLLPPVEVDELVDELVEELEDELVELETSTSMSMSVPPVDDVEDTFPDDVDVEPPLVLEVDETFPLEVEDPPVEVDDPPVEVDDPPVDVEEPPDEVELDTSTTAPPVEVDVEPVKTALPPLPPKKPPEKKPPPIPTPPLPPMPTLGPPKPPLPPLPKSPLSGK